MKTKRRLPHWYREAATYFIIFRLADSLPQSVLAQWKLEQEEWLVSNPEPHSSEQKNELARVFSRRQHGWLDAGHGDCILRRLEVAFIVSTALLHFDGDRYELGDFVVMPNHVHLLVTPRDHNDLSDILHSWKSFSAKRINKLLGRTGTLWQDESYDHLVRSEAQLEHYRCYIAENPAKARLREGEFVLRVLQ